MDLLENLIEYYDELYPVGNDQKIFFGQMLSTCQIPAKILRIGCATGGFEHYLARLGHDVTGIDTSNALVDSAALRRMLPNTAIRFFHMEPIEMTRFLGKKFYNIITSLEGSLCFIHDKTLRRKFFYDCHALLAEGGSLIIHIPSIDIVRKSSRVSLRSKIECKIQLQEEDLYTLTQEIKKEDGRRIPIHEGTKFAQTGYSEIKEFALGAGFASVKYFSGYDMQGVSDEAKATLFIIE